MLSLVSVEISLKTLETLHTNYKHVCTYLLQNFCKVGRKVHIDQCASIITRLCRMLYCVYIYAYVGKKRESFEISSRRAKMSFSNVLVLFACPYSSREIERYVLFDMTSLSRVKKNDYKVVKFSLDASRRLFMTPRYDSAFTTRDYFNL